MSISVRDALSPYKSGFIAVFIGIVAVVVGYFVDRAYFSDDSPDQPINFSHRIHAGSVENGGNEIPCMHCHVYADRTFSAGVPSVNKCMNCHKAVATEKPEIKKVAGYWERREPIMWIKVYDLPDFVHFPHKRHVKAGLECQECHGPVETMDKIVRQQELKMPFCVDCHTEREVVNGRDCWTCHK